MTWANVTTPTAGGVVSDTDFGVPVANNVNAVGAAWTAFTPTANNVTLGNGTLTGRYHPTGQTVDFQITLTFGSTTALTGSPTFTPPVTALAAGQPFGDCNAFDSSAGADYPINAKLSTTTLIVTRAFPTTAGNALVGLGATVPFTWAAGDVLTINGRYEAA